MPVVEPTVACDGLLLVHIPPDVAELSVVVTPVHTVVVPVIVAGSAFTVIVLVARAPHGVFTE